MEGCFIDERNGRARMDADRYLRAYRKLNSVLGSSCACGRELSEEFNGDEAAIHAQMYEIRSVILTVDDAYERMFLYYYYVKGKTLEKCAALLGVSMRTVCRLKNRALASAAERIKISAQ